jgi:hypothetical protein
MKGRCVNHAASKRHENGQRLSTLIIRVKRRLNI